MRQWDKNRRFTRTTHLTPYLTYKHIYYDVTHVIIEDKYRTGNLYQQPLSLTRFELLELRKTFYLSQNGSTLSTVSLTGSVRVLFLSDKYTPTTQLVLFSLYLTALLNVCTISFYNRYFYFINFSFYSHLLLSYRSLSN